MIAVPVRALAVLDIGDDGPVIDAGGFRMRVTNAGIVGNAFLDAGRSFDPSFEFPPYSGIELLNYASLWVGAVDDRNRTRVSGGPLLEFRPTLDPADDVRTVHRGEPGTKWRFDDDHDGRIDEEILNGKDDDGDGQIDEDLGFTFDELMAADYVDDRPEATNYAYDTGETHVPLGLSVHQEVGAWSRVGFNHVAVLRYTITHHGSGRLHDVYVGLLTDLDVTLRSDRTGHLDDRAVQGSWSRTFNEGLSDAITLGYYGPVIPGMKHDCFVTRSYSGPMLVDGFSPDLPIVTVVPLDHTVDPVARVGPIASYARAPGQVSFRSAVFSARGVSGQGGVPRFDADRYEALAGRLSTSTKEKDDQVVLISCGPFRTLDPGQSLTFDVALVASGSADSLATAIGNLFYLHQGYELDLIPDYMGRDSLLYLVGETGRNGHDTPIAAPPGVTFIYDKDCVAKIPDDIEPLPTQTLFEPGVPHWTDTDCDECTGRRGLDTRVHYIDPGQVPPAPRMRASPGDHDVLIAWDNTPEALLAAGQYGGGQSRFLGYRIYRLADWRDRRDLLPPLDNWSLRAAFGPDSVNGEIPLAGVTDSTVVPEGTLLGQTLYPPGRYAFHDRTAGNGFDYVYVVTAVYELRITGGPNGAEISVLESPIIASFDDRVSPQAATRTTKNAVWVVPNPFRGAAGWDRPPTLGDPLPRHIDFMGLPPGRAVIKIWTVAGDLVARVDHDGAGGDGQASWDLVSRNGQDIESGIYLFTVDSSLGTQRGKFVVVR